MRWGWTLVLLLAACRTAQPVLHIWTGERQDGTVLLVLTPGSDEYPNEKQKDAAHVLMRTRCVEAGWEDGSYAVEMEGLNNAPNLRVREYHWNFTCRPQEEKR